MTTTEQNKTTKLFNLLHIHPRPRVCLWIISYQWIYNTTYAWFKLNKSVYQTQSIRRWYM